LSNAGKVRGLWQHTQMNSFAFHRGVTIHDGRAADCKVHQRIKIPYLRTCSPPRRVLCRWSPQQGYEDRETTKQSFTFQVPIVNRRASRRRQSSAKLYGGWSTTSTTDDKAFALIPTTNLAVAKGKENLYTKPRIDKYYRCGESEHKSIECLKREANMADCEEEDEVQIETEPKDSDFVEEHGDLVVCVIQKVLCN